jgi:hypothetical protein
MNNNTAESRIADLEARVQTLEKTVSIDRFKAEQEKTRRTNKEQQIKADRLTIRVSRGDDGALLLAEMISDPVKFNRLVKKHVISKIVHVKSSDRGAWAVHVAAADREGILLRDAVNPS